MFKYAMKCGFLAIQRNPVDLVEVRNMPATTAPKRIKALPTLEQYRALLEDPYLPEICKVVVQMICCTGLRGCEAWALKAEDLDYRAGKIYVRRSAKGKYIDPPKSKESAATVCMEKPLATLLRRWMSTYPLIDGYLFASPNTGRPYSPNDMQQSHLAMAGRRAGIDNLGWHNFRHWHRALGRHVAATPEQQKMMMRHSTISMAMDVYGNQIDNADLVREPNRKIVSILMKTGTGE
jgi:integrase